MNRTARERSDFMVIQTLLFLVAFMGLVFAVASLPPPPGRHTPSTAVCSTDADCAQWELDHHVPDADRCHGGPCSKDGAR